MARIAINIGTNPNDGTGELLRSAMSSINSMFTEQYALNSATINAGAVEYDFSGATDEQRIQGAIDAAVLAGADRVFVPASMLPYDASLVTFNSAVQMVREGGAFNVYDVHAYGATGDGVTDDTVAVQAAIDASANKSICVLSNGTYLISTALTYPAGKRTQLVGASIRTSTLVSAGTNGLVNITLGHLLAEYFCSLENVLLDGNNTSTADLLTMTTTSLFRLHNVEARNATGTIVRLVSCWDTIGVNVYLGATGVGAAAFVMDGQVLEGQTLHECAENRFFSLHVEGDPGANPLIDLIGGATAQVRLNVFYFTKAHGNPATSNPNGVPVIRIGANARRNRFFGGEVAYGRGAPQIQISGNQNAFYDFDHIVGTVPPTFAVSLLAGNDNHVVGHSSESSAFTSGIFNVAAGVSRTRIVGPSWNAAIPTLIVDAGFRTDVARQPAVVALAYGATVATDAALGDFFEVAVTDGVAFTISNPTNAQENAEIEYSIYNNSGGAMGAITWGSEFKLAGAFTNPATGQRRAITFRRRNLAWRETTRTAADQPN